MEWSIVQSVINLALAVAVFYFARKKDTHDGAVQNTEVIVELRTVRRDLGELKSDVQAMRQEWREDHDTLIGVMREQKAMWKIIDAIKGVKEDAKN